MRVENTNIKLTIPIPIDNPDKNGVVYTKEAVENALNNLQTNLPIVYKGDVEEEESLIGVTTGKTHIVSWDSDNQVCKVTIDGTLYYSGAEIVVNEIENGEITDFRIKSIGLTR